MSLKKMVFDKGYEFSIRDEKGQEVYIPSRFFLSDLYLSEGLTSFIDIKGNPFMIGEEKSGHFVENITEKKIPLLGRIEIVDHKELLRILKDMRDNQSKIESFIKIINKAFYDINANFDNYSRPGMEEEARRRALQFNAYSQGSSNINPYTRDDSYNIRHNIQSYRRVR